jgi:hypothetical protein
VHLSGAVETEPASLGQARTVVCILKNTTDQKYLTIYGLFLLTGISIFTG